MRLLPKKIAALLPPLYSTESTPLDEKIAVVKFFGGSRGSWYGIEFDGVDLFFGYIVSPLGPDCDELGYFSLSELAKMRFKPFGLPIERDLYFSPSKMSKIAR